MCDVGEPYTAVPMESLIKGIGGFYYPQPLFCHFS